MAETDPGEYRVTPYGDSALLLTPASGTSSERRTAAARLRSAITLRRPRGVVELVAGLESLLVEFDPLVISHEALADTLLLIAAVPAAAAEADPARAFVIPVVFGGEHSPDLQAVAAGQGLTVDEAVEAFTGSTLTIALLASAMAPMMEGVRLPRPIPRLAEPRADVPPGSIMVAGNNAIIQPFPGPSGWQVIGRTPLTICDISRNPGVSFRPGDTVRFSAVEPADWDTLAGTFLEPQGAAS